MKKVLPLLLIFTMVSSLFGVVPSIVSAQPQANGLVFELGIDSFDGSAETLTDKADGNATFAFASAPTLNETDTAGGKTKYLTFADYPIDGEGTGIDTGIRVTDNDILNQDALTIETWAYFGPMRSSAQSDSLYDLFAITNGSGDGGRAMEMMFADGKKAKDILWRPGFKSTSGMIEKRSNINAYAEQWTHVVVTRKWDGTNWIFDTYFNGVKKSEFSGSETGNKIDESGKFLHIGGGPTTAQRGFYGSISTFKVYNTALSETQVKANYESEAPNYYKLADTLEVISTNPAEGNLLPYTAGTITVDFNNYLSAGSIAQNAKLQKADGSEIKGGSYAKLGEKGTQVQVAYGTLEKDTQYKLVLETGLTSLNDKTLSETVEILFTTNNGIIINEDFTSADYVVGSAPPTDKGIWYTSGEGNIPGATNDATNITVKQTENGRKYISIMGDPAALNKNSGATVKFGQNISDSIVVAESIVRASSTDPNRGNGTAARDLARIYGGNANDFIRMGAITGGKPKNTIDPNDVSSDFTFTDFSADEDGFYSVKTEMKKDTETGFYYGELTNMRDVTMQPHIRKDKAKALEFVNGFLITHIYPQDSEAVKDASDIAGIKIYTLTDPKVLAAKPYNEADKTIDLVFNSDLSGSSFTEEQVTVKKASNGETVNCTVTYDEASRAMQLKFPDGLSTHQEYTVSFYNVKDTAGNEVRYSHTFLPAESELYLKGAITYKNQSGETTQDFGTSTSLTADMLIGNNTGIAQTVAATFVSYRNGAYQRAAVTSTDIGKASEGTATASITDLAPQEGDSLKLLLWDGLNTMKPIIGKNGEEIPYTYVPEPDNTPILDKVDIKEVVDFDKVEEPYYMRGGLPNVKNKLDNTEDNIKVAFIGGSITEGSGYRDLTMNWLEETYGSRFTSLNAGVGGTPSDFGAVRFGTDIIPFDPDLLFVEFAVNDGGISDKAKVESMEGIVRQAWQHNPKMDIIFVYTVQESGLETAAAGKYTPAAKIHDYIANYYNIPSVFMGYDVAKLAVNGDVVWNGQKAPEGNTKPVFSEDGTHPNATGSQYYFDVLGPALEDILTNGQGADEAHTFGIPLISTNWGNLITVDPKNVTTSAGWEELSSTGTKIESIWQRRAPYAYHATEVGETMTIEFDGTQAGILYLPGPDAPNVDILIDNQQIADQSLFDVWHGVRGYTILYFMTPVLEDGHHTLTFRVNDTVADKAQMIRNSNYFVNENLAFMEANKEWFEQKNFIVGKVIINGQLSN